MGKKKYSPEFKLDAINLVLEQGYAITGVAKSLDLNSNMLGRWIKEYKNEE
jgi:transposase